MSEPFEKLPQVPDPSAYEGPGRRDLEYQDVRDGDRIGAGGFAQAFRVTLGDQDLVIKEPFVEGTVGTDTLDAFVNEAETWSRLDDHPHIVDVVDWGTRLPWIAVEYMNGGSLADRLAEGSLEPTEALWLGTRLSRAVQHAHRHGVVHLDLTPKNVLFRTTDDGVWNVPKISDWGTSRSLLHESGTIEGVTPNYAAPEQFDRETFGEPDDFTDRFQLAAVVYETLTGEQAFPGSGAAALRCVLDGDVTSPTAVAPDLPPQVDEIFDRALARDKSDRYETVVNFRQDLTDVLEGLPSDSDATSGANRGGAEVATAGREPEARTEPRSSEPDSEPSDPATTADSGAGSRRPTTLYEYASDVDTADGPTVDRLLGSLAFEATGERKRGPLRLAVDSTYTTDGEIRVVVHVVSGTLSDPVDLEFQPSGARMRVAAFEEYLTGDAIDTAEPGDTVTLEPDSVTNGDEIDRGDFAAPSENAPATLESVEARLHVLDHPSVVTAGYTPVLHAHTAQRAASVSELHRRLIPTDGGTWDVEQSPDYAEPGDLVDVVFSPMGGLALDPVEDAPETGAFVLRDAGQAVALGIVTDVRPATAETESTATPDTVGERTNDIHWERISTTDFENVADIFEQLPPGLDDETVQAPEDAPLRLPIDDVYTLSDIGTVPVGRIETGILERGDGVSFQPSDVSGEVTTIEIQHEEVSRAEPGDDIGFGVDDIGKDDIRRGDVCGPADDPPTVAERFEAQIVVSQHPSVITAGYTPVFHVHTAQVACTIEEIDRKIDPSSGEVVERNPDFIQSGDAAVVTVRPQKSLSVEPCSEIPELGSFAVRDMGQTIAAGRVLEVSKRE